MNGKRKLVLLFALTVLLLVIPASVVGADCCDPCPPPPCPPPPPPPCEGCTPGYWKQEQHFDSWVGYAPGALFVAIFGVDPLQEMTLLDALSVRNKEVGSGVEAALIRHAVAALLNSSAIGDGWPTPVEIIEDFATAYGDKDAMEDLKDQLAAMNELGCPFN